MLQNPKQAFKDPDLKTCVIARDNNNQPRACSGAFAVVYKGTYQAGAARQGNVAVRVFSSASSERQDRYRAISEYLKKNPLKCLVDFEYLEKGILHGKSGKWYPLVRMEWVQGDILYNVARNLCQAGDSKKLTKLSDSWVNLVAELARARIAHGDLQHANVMVTDSGDLKLVDYDCMCVPALEGRRNLELGVVPYQNPKRTDDTLLFSGLDNFSSLFIFVALRALSASPKLWDIYVEPPTGALYDKLLIRDTDFQNPGASVLYGDLKRSPDQKLRKWTDELFRFWHADLKDIPSLNELVNDFEKVRSLLTAKAFDEALTLLNQQSPTGLPPKELQASIDNAKQRIKCREDLERAINSGNELAIKQAYRPPLLDDYAKAQPAVAIARDADRAIAALQKLQTARAAQEWRKFVDAWDHEARLLTPRKSAVEIAKEARRWKQLNATCDEVWLAYRRRPADLSALHKAWRQLEQLGGHPETQSERTQIEDLLRKFTLLAEFIKLQGPQGEKLDASRCRAWREDDFREWDEAEPYRREFDAAYQRLRLATELRRLVGQWPQPSNVESEQSISEQLARLPTAYEIDEAIRKRAVDAAERMRFFQALQQAAAHKPLRDSLLGKAWQELVKLNGQALVPAKHHPRLDLAVKRVPVVTAVAAISLSLPMDQLDAALLKVWNKALLTDYEKDPDLRCAEVDAWRIPYDHALTRRQLLHKLEQALATSDAMAVKDLSASPLLKNYPFAAHLRTQITSSLTELDACIELQSIIRTGDRQRFFRQFNATLIKRFPSGFQPLSAELNALLESEVLPSDKNGFRHTLGSESIVERSGQLIFDIQWGWPDRRFVDSAIVGICRGEPPRLPERDKLVARHTTDRAILKQGTGRFVLPAKPDWLNCMVVVWGIIDLGFGEHFTEPFVVGRLSSRDGK